MTIAVSSVGARVLGLRVADRTGNEADVLLGYADPAALRADAFRMGALVGRYAGRIRQARFALNGKVVSLSANAGGHCLHGGETGFADRDWSLEAIAEAEDQRFRFMLDSEDGDQGFPGALSVIAEYRWHPAGRLSLQIDAVSGAPTPVCVSQHLYWNLGGAAEPDIARHLLQVRASHYLPLAPDGVPTGEIRPVAGTPFDLRTPVPLGERLSCGDPAIVAAGGFDHCWCADGTGLREVAVLHHPPSGRTMHVWSDQPGLQIYTGNTLDVAPAGKAGRPMARHAGIALETQNYPDAPNQPSFPDPILRPGQRWRSQTVFVFSA